MPKVIVNNKEFELPAGTSALDAVFHAGYDVPYFCSNEYLSPVGACRMCLVDAGSPRKNPDGTFVMDEATGQPKIFFFPNPVASCTLAISDGMVINTNSAPVVKAQAGMMEMTLLNHPLDCPTCDKGGACELQDRAYEYGYGEARFEFTRRHADKHHALSEFIVLDKERCIHCKRCVRYFEEIPGNEVLDFIERGGHTFIDSFQSEDLAGRELGNFSGNITDICPVGALLDNVARFRGRNWEYDRTQTINMTDSDGASIWVDARTGRIERIRAAHNPSVNEIWIHDAARFGHEWVDSNTRIRKPLVRKNGVLQEASWDEAVAAIKAGMENTGKDKIGLYASADITLEEGIAFEKFAEALATPHLDHFPRRSAVLSSANRPTFIELAKADAVIVIGADLIEESGTSYLRIEEMLKGVLSDAVFHHGAPLADLRLQERMNRKRNKLAVFAPVFVEQMKHAGIAAQYALGNELELLKQLEAAKKGESQTTDAIKKAGALLSGAKNPVIVLGSFALAENAAAVLAAANKLGAKVLPIPAAANGAGLELLNLIPGKDGKAFGNFDGLKAAFISGVQPAKRPNLGFYVAHTTTMMNATLEADVVLPAASNYEKRGTTMNLEGRLLPLSGAAVDAGESVDLSGAIQTLADALGIKPEIRGTRSAQRELQNIFGLELDKLPKEGVFPTKKPTAKSAPVELPPAPSRDSMLDDYALLVPSMWNARMLQSERVQAAVGKMVFTLNAVQAQKIGVRDGFDVEIELAGQKRAAVVHVRADAQVPTIAALDGQVPGTWAHIHVNVPALVGGDD